MGLNKSILAAFAGLAAGVFLGSSTPTSSQTAEALRSSSEAAADQAADLQVQIAALVDRVENLEEAEKEPKTTPFKVANKAGQVIFSVDEAGAGAHVQLLGAQGTVTLKTDSGAKINLTNGGMTTTVAALPGEPGFRFNTGKQSFAVEQNSGGMLLSLSEGKNGIDLLARAEGPLISADMNNQSVALGATGKAFGFSLFDGELPTIVIGDVGKGQPSLRIYEKGSSGPTLQAGYHANGINGISLWEGDNQLVKISKASGGAAGLVNIFDDGKEVVTVGKFDEMTGLRVKSADAVTFAGYDKEGPSLNLSQGAERFFFAGHENNQPQLRLGSKSKNHWSLFSTEDGVGLLGSVKNRIVATVLGNKLSGTYVQIADKILSFIGVPAAGGGDSGAVIVYGKGGEFPIASMGMDKDNQPSVRVREPGGGKDLAVLRSKDGKEGELKLFDAAGETAKMGSLKGTGTLALSEAGTPAVTLGPTETKTLPAFRAYHKGQMVVAAGATSAGTGAVVVYSGSTIGAGLEGSEGGGDVYVMSKGAEVVSINSVDKPGQGLVVVRSPTGTAVATLGYGSSGGGNVTASDPSGSGVFSAGYIGGDGPGAACVSHKGTKCLGIGLTGMEGFH